MDKATSVLRLPDVRKLLRPYNKSANHLTPAQTVLQAASYRLITTDQFNQIQRDVRGRGSKDIKQLVWPLESQRPTPQKLRSRPDVAERMKLAQEIDHSVVTWSWNKICKTPAHALPIQQALTAANKIAFEGFELANIHILRLCAEKKPISPLDQSFYYRCCNAVCVDKKGKRVVIKEDKELDKTAENYTKWRSSSSYEPIAKQQMRPIMQVLSRDMATCTSNMIQATFYSRFFKWIRNTLGCSTKYTKNICAQVWGDQQDNATQDPFIQRARSLIPSFPLVDKHIHTYINPLYLFQRSSRCSLLPHKGSFKTSFLTINTNTLRTLMLMAGIEGVPDESAFLQNKSLWWRRMFNVHKLETCTRSFAYEIATDGRSVSIVMSKPKKACSEANLPELTVGTNIWSLDPGARCIFTSTGIRYNGQGEPSTVLTTKKCTGREYYHKAGYTKTNKLERKWLLSDSKVQEALSDMPIRHYTSVHGGRQRLEYVWSKYELVSSHFGQRRYKNVRITRRINGLRQLRSMCLSLTEGSTDKKATIVGFGDWSATTHHRTSTPGPSKRFRNELARIATVVDVGEQYTSKTCSNCHLQCLENMRCQGKCKKTKQVQKVKVHGVLHCTNSECKGKTWDRDINAARNILEITMCQLLGWPRPSCFAKQ
jgi:hypothetical protein